MDRPIIYPQEQGRSTDILFGQRAMLIGLSKLAEAILGTTTQVTGLAVSATSPASMNVSITPGQIYELDNIDSTDYGVLAADTTHQILKQGVLLDASSLSCPAPTTAGNSINYLIEASFQENDTTNVVLPYFNSANPSQPLTGQNNSGASQPTQRNGQVVLAVKAGASAATGTQTTPSPDAGYVGLAVVTVAYGQTSITNTSISQYSGSPNITYTLGDRVASALLADTVNMLNGVSLVGGAARVVNSMAALRALPKTGAQNVFVTGYRNDTTYRGGGKYNLNASDVTTGAFFVGSISGTVLTITSIINGTIAVGEQLNWNGSDQSIYLVPGGTGTGGAGTYNLSAAPGTVTSQNMTTDNGGTTVVSWLDGGRWDLDHDGEVHIEQFGGDITLADNSYQMEAATNWANGRPVLFGVGSTNTIYNVTRALTNLSVWAYCWKGARGEYTAHGWEATPTVAQTVIKYRPASNLTYMVTRSDPTAPLGGNIGPFIHEDILFDATGNVFQFGNEALGPVVDGAGEKYVQGVAFIRSYVSADAQTLTSDTSGKITRSGTIPIHLTKCFSTVFEDFGMDGGDVGIRMFGCDQPDIRGQFFMVNQNIPIEIQASGSFTVWHKLRGLNLNHWGLAAMTAFGCGVSVEQARTEVGAGSVVGRGALNLTTGNTGGAALGITAAVTSGSNSLTFNKDMTNILFPNVSIIELVSSINNTSDYVLVISVSAATVTFDNSLTNLMWNDPAATVIRLHGYGFLHAYENGAYSNINHNIEPSTPAFAFAPSNGSVMSISDASNQDGNLCNSIVLANKTGVGVSTRVGVRMTFSACRDNVIADPNHPLVYVDNWKENHGGNFNINGMQLGQDLADAESLVIRRWIFTPKRGMSVFNPAGIQFAKRFGDSNTDQVPWAIYIPPGETALFYDSTLPSSSYGQFKISFLVEPAAVGTDTFSPSVVGNGGGPLFSASVAHGTPQVVQYAGAIPSVWKGTGRTVSTGFQIGGGTNGWYVYAIIVEDRPMDVVGGGNASGSSQKLIGFHDITPLAATNIAQIDLSELSNGYALICRVKCQISSRPTGGYASTYKEFIAHFGNDGSLVALGADTALTSQKSVNSSVILIDATLACSISGTNGLLTLTPTITGSSGGNEVYVTSEIEILTAGGVYPATML